MIKPLQSITLKNDSGEDTTYVVASAPAIVETTEPASVASISDGAEGIPVKSLLADINPVQTGSGDPSPSNVRPITGWTGMNVYQSIFCKRFIPTSYSAGDVIETKNGVTVEYLGDGKYHLFGTNTSASTTNFTPVAITSFTAQTQDDEHRIFAFNNNATGSANINFRSNGTWLSNATFNAVNREFTYTSTLTGKEITDFFFSVSANATVDIICTPTFYDKNNTPLPISWADEAGTVYGGTLDVTTGLLTVDRASLTITNFTNLVIESSGFRSYDPCLPEMSVSYGEVASNMFVRGTSYAEATGGVKNAIGYNAAGQLLFNVWVNGAYITSKADLNSFVANNPIQIVYPLKTPQTYQLTPQAVLTILGTNNIWADTGDVEVAYVADTKMYIDKMISEL